MTTPKHSINKTTPRGPRSLPPRRRDEGIALILALLFVVLLTVIVVEFSYEMNVDASLIQRHTSNTQAYMAAKSAIALSMSVLAADLLFGEEEEEINAGGLYDSLDEPWAESTQMIALNDASVTIQITDEYGKINLNAIIYEDGAAGEKEYQPLVDALYALFELRELDILPIDVILDWLDADDIPRPLGAENSYYQNLEVPFECKNGPMDSIEELLLLPGITPEVYFGEGEFPQPALSELLTVHGHPEGRVNINTAPIEVLDAMFIADGTSPSPEQRADEVRQRILEEGPYRSEEELRASGLVPEPLAPPQPADPQNPNQAEPPPPPPDLFDVASEVFRIQGDGQSGDSQIRIEAFVWRDTYGSGAAQMFRIIDWRVIR